MNNEAKERCKYELFVEKYFGLIPEITNEETKVVTDYGQLVNLLTTFESKFKNSVGKPVVDTDSGLNIPDVIVSVCKCETSTWNRDAGCMVCDECGEVI